MPIDFQLENKNKNKNQDCELKPKLETKNNKNSSKLQEKIEQMKKILGKVWNNPYGKASTSAIATLLTIGTLKFTYDAKNTNRVNLTPADTAWIKKNMILFDQKFPLCWHNVFMQLLLCPEYIYYSNLPDHPIRKSKKIMTMIDFAKSELNKKFTGNFLKRKVGVLLEVRQMPDDIFDKDAIGKLKLNNYSPNKTWLTDGKKHGFVLHDLYAIRDGDYRFNGIQVNELGIFDVPVTEYCDSDEILERTDDDVYYVEKPISEVSAAKVREARMNNSISKVYGWYSYEDKENAMKYYTQRAENILIEYGRETLNEIPAKDINCCQKYGYYPTFVVIFDKVDYSSVPHYHCCYIVYDKNKKIKFFLWGDGIKNGFRVIPENESLEKLNKYSVIWVKYSRSDIVEKFYTP